VTFDEGRTMTKRPMKPAMIEAPSVGHRSPTFLATFIDGTTTRMTVWQDPARGSLDLSRGVRLARHAYQSRMKRKPPPIVGAQYVDGDEVLQRYSKEQLS
jgi:hypothetical protein